MDNGTIVVDFTNLKGDYFVQAEIDNLENPEEKIYSYYLVNSYGEQVIDLTTIYPNFVL